MAADPPTPVPTAPGHAADVLTGPHRPRVRVVVPVAGSGDLPAVRGLLAGAAEVDITPPPGMPKAGHSRNAQDGTGFRTRLRARALHLRAGTTSLALLQCDLMAGSSVLHHLVADAVAADTDLRLPGIFLGATHTHAGPGQYCGNDFNNRFASNRPGFDPAFTRFLVTRLAAAVRDAVASRRPARLAFGATEVWGLTRNRSLEPHLENTTVADKRRVPQRKYSAVNPWLHLIRVDGEDPQGGLAPLAAMAVFSIHGTGISQRDPAYNADVWAYLTGELQHRIESTHGVRPVVGAVEGTHGDVAPAVRPGMLVYPEAERVGRGIGQAAAELYQRLEGELSATVPLAAGLREVDLGARDTDGIGVTVADPASGAATLAGAYENTTPVIHRIPPFRPGWPHRVPRGPHGAKRVVGTRWLQPLIVPTESFPRVVPFQVLRIGDRALVALPFEVTVESGRRVEEAVARSLGPGSGISRVVVSSLANDQLHYLTTPEEYGRQYYEGGNTVLGPTSQPWAAAHAARLAADVLRSGHVADHRPVARFDLRARRFLAGPEPGDARLSARVFPGPATFVDPTVTEDGYWEQQWLDVSPGSLDWHRPLVRVEALEDGRWTPASRHGLPADDQGWHLGVVHLGPVPGGGHRYAARWFDPQVGGGPPHRLALLPNAGRPAAAGQPFR